MESKTNNSIYPYNLLKDLFPALSAYKISPRDLEARLFRAAYEIGKRYANGARNTKFFLQTYQYENAEEALKDSYGLCDSKARNIKQQFLNCLPCAPHKEYILEEIGDTEYTARLLDADYKRECQQEGSAVALNKKSMREIYRSSLKYPNNMLKFIYGSDVSGETDEEIENKLMQGTMERFEYLVDYKRYLEMYFKEYASEIEIAEKCGKSADTVHFILKDEIRRLRWRKSKGYVLHAIIPEDWRRWKGGYMPDFISGVENP